MTILQDTFINNNSDKTITIFMNCHGLPLMKLLNSNIHIKKNYNLSYICANIYAKDRKTYSPEHLKIFNNSTIFICQYFRTQRKLLNNIKISYNLQELCTIINIPHYTFSGYLYDNGISNIKASNGIILLNETKRLLKKNIFKKDLEKFIDNELNHIKKLDELSDVKLYNFIKNNFRKCRLFADRGHAMFPLIEEIYRQIIKKLNILNDVDDKLYNKIYFYKHCYVPILKQVAEILNFTFKEIDTKFCRHLSIFDYNPQKVRHVPILYYFIYTLHTNKTMTQLYHEKIIYKSNILLMRLSKKIHKITKKNSKNKIAILLTGRLYENRKYSIEETAKFILNSFKHFDFDIFAVTTPEGSYMNKDEIKLCLTKLYNNKITKLHFSNRIELNKFMDNLSDECSLKNTMLRYYDPQYKKYKCFQLMEEYMSKNLINYKYIIWNRFDNVIAQCPVNIGFHKYIMKTSSHNKFNKFIKKEGNLYVYETLRPQYLTKVPPKYYTKKLDLDKLNINDNDILLPDEHDEVYKNDKFAVGRYNGMKLYCNYILYTGKYTDITETLHNMLDNDKNINKIEIDGWCSCYT